MAKQKYNPGQKYRMHFTLRRQEGGNFYTIFSKGEEIEILEYMNKTTKIKNSSGLVRTIRTVFLEVHGEFVSS